LLPIISKKHEILGMETQNPTTDNAGAEEKKIEIEIEVSIIL